jgi:excinuclease ABC subunit A
LSPAISIDQKSASRNPRSTVGTVTEIYDYMRLLWARIGVPHCPVCGEKIYSQSIQQMTDQLLSLGEGVKLVLLAPLVRDQKGEHKMIFEQIRKSGFARVRVDGVIMDLQEALNLELAKQIKHTIEIVVDRVTISQDEQGRLTESLEKALDFGDGLVVVSRMEESQNTKMNITTLEQDMGNFGKQRLSIFAWNGQGPESLFLVEVRVCGSLLLQRQGSYFQRSVD